uniref:Core-2/I-Branching enzyme n=1 Tax=Parascaris univalens TaxID=6257 RepID=A0A915AN78_PARUN
MYSPENIFCYAIDRKASIKFHQQMRNLSYCFPNIYLTKTEYDVDSAGHNMDQSFLECLQTIRHLPNWKYAILLQMRMRTIIAYSKSQKVVRRDHCLERSSSLSLISSI